MFEFKRDSSPSKDETPVADEFNADAGSSGPVRQAASRSGRHDAAVIGPSIHIEGDLSGKEDLVIEGEVKGVVHLKDNTLTIGSEGKVVADVYAHTIYVDGKLEGDLYGSERVSIRKTAQVRGNITSPRVSLEDGARFMGSIEMDPEAETLQKAFGSKRENVPGSASAASLAGKTMPASGSAAADPSARPQTRSGGMAAKGGGSA